MKKNIFVSLFFLNLNIIIQSAENTSPANIVTIFNAPSETRLKDIGFFDNTIVSVGYNKPQNKIFLYQFSLSDNQTKELFSAVPSDENDIEFYFIACNKNQNRVVITQKGEDALFLELGKEKPNNIPIQPFFPGNFINEDTIIWVDTNKLCHLYDIKSATNRDFPYNDAIENLNQRKDLRSFYNQIDKNPNKNEFALALELDLAVFDGDKAIDGNNPAIIPLKRMTTDRNGDPIEVHLETWDIHYSHDGSHIAFTWYVPYNAWIINTSTQQYFALEDIPNKDYGIDTKVFHPNLPILATLRKCDGEIKFWYVPNGRCLITQTLPEKTGSEPVSCLTHFLSFSHNGTLLAIHINSKIFVIKVPENLEQLTQVQQIIVYEPSRQPCAIV